MNIDTLNVTDKDERLIVDDTDFLIAARIEQAAPEMMIRELIQNGIEAVKTVSTKNRKIVISKEIHFGVPKLCIYNTGIGMDAEQLYNMGNLACAINKEHALNKNFGEGAKVSSLLYNSFGMIYDSCHNGEVSRIWLRKNNDKYGRRTFNDSRVVQNVSKAVLDVTDEYSPTELRHDWTKVVLLGRTKEQDTVSDPYGSGTILKDSWFAEYLYHRFYRIDPTIKILLQGVGHKSKEQKTLEFETIEERRVRPCVTRHGTQIGVFSRSETVNLVDGIKLHFIHDALNGTNRVSNSRGGLQTDVTFGGIVYKNELYSFFKGSDWTSKCFRVGISYGGNVLSVLIELPDNRSLVPDAFRKNLIDLDKDRHQVMLDNFSDLIMTNLPEWVKEIIDENSPSKTSSFDDVEKKLRELMIKLSLKRDVELLEKTPGEFDLSEDGILGAEVLSFPNGESSNDIIDPEPTKKKKKIAHIDHGNKSSKTVSKPHAMFEIHLLTKEQDIIEKGIVGKAGLYVRSTNDLFINLMYPEIQNMYEILYVNYPNAATGLFQKRAYELIEKHMTLRVGSSVVRALAKQSNGEWNREDVDKALTSETLSMSADNDEYHIPIIKSRLSAEFLTNKVINIVK